MVLLGLVTPRRGVTDGRGGMIGGRDWFSLPTPPPPALPPGIVGRFFRGRGTGLNVVPPLDLLVVVGVEVEVERDCFLSMVR